MPLIPTYDGPQLRQQGVPDAYQANQDVSSGSKKFAQGLDDAAAAADKIGLQQDTIAAQDAETTVRSEWFKADEELRQKYQGQNAAGYQAAVDAWWKDAPQKYGQGLNGRAQMLASKSLIAAQDAAMRTSAVYAREEITRAATDKFVSTKADDVQTALANVSKGDLSAPGIAAATIKQRNQEWATQHGWSDEQRDMQNVKDLTALHYNTVMQLKADGKISEAQTYWKTVNKKDEFDATKIDEVNAVLKEGVANLEGGAAGRAVWQTYMNDKAYGAVVPEKEMDAELVKQFGDDPQKLAAARQELNYQQGLWTKQVTSVKAKAVQDVYDQINKGTPINKVELSTAWGQMTPEERKSIKQEVEDRQHAMWARGWEDTMRREAMKTYRTAPTMLALAQKPEALANMTPEAVVAMMPAIGQENTKILLDRQAQYKNSQAKLSEAKLDNDMIESVMSSVAGVDPKPKATDKEATAKVWALRSAIETEVGEAQQKAKGELSRAEKEKIARDVAARKVRTGWWSGDQQIDTLSPEARNSATVKVKRWDGATAAVPIGSIPTGELAKVKKSLADAGLPSDDVSAVHEWYAVRNPAPKQGQVPRSASGTVR